MDLSEFRGIGTRFHARLGRRRDRLLSALLDRVDRLAGGARQTPGPAIDPTGIAIVGCGFVADFYAARLPDHPELKLVGAMDRLPSRADRLASRHGVRAYASLEELLSDPAVELVVNLTNPGSHFAVSKAILEAGKHVYSEKPLAMTLAEAEELVALAEAYDLLLCSAPCSILGESAQVLARALAADAIGPARLAYAELDDGPLHRMGPESWTSPQGTPWPWRDEFAVGCTLEHAPYHLTWLATLFGPASSVSGFSSRLIAEKHPDMPAAAIAPDFSVGCIHFHSGAVARLTCSIVAPRDHSLRIIGDKGVLSVDECWHFASPVRLRRFTAIGLRAETYPWLLRSRLARLLYGLDGRRLESQAGWRSRLKRQEMDYLVGIREMVASLREGRPCRLSTRLALHVTEIALAIQNAGQAGAPVPIRSTFPWPAPGDAFAQAVSTRSAAARRS